MQIIKKLFCSHFSVNKGLIQHVVQSCYNYNITFRKLEIHTVKMRPISACYTSGRGNSLNRALFELRPLHYYMSPRITVNMSKIVTYLSKLNYPLLLLEIYAIWLASATTSCANTLVAPAGFYIIVICNACS